MRVGFDISQTGSGKAGCGFFSDGLIKALAQLRGQNEYILYPTFGDFYFDPRVIDSRPIEQENIRYGLCHWSAEKAREFWCHPPDDYEMKLGSPDIVHSNNFFCPKKLHTARLVYTLYDLGFIENPEWTTEQNRTGCFSGVFDASLYADHLIAISEYSRQHFLKTFPHYDAARVSVVYPGSRFVHCERLARPKRLEPLRPERFWLSVGTFEPRKNHLRLIGAYARLKAEFGRDSLPLVLSGGSGWLMEDFEKKIAALGLGGDVILTGYVDDTAIQWLYQNCFATIYPSLFEGFGLPVLEAITLGAPVITSNITSIPEIVGDGGGIVIDPAQEDQIRKAMAKLLKGETSRERLKEQGLKRAEQFSWQRTAQGVLDVYERVLRQPKHNLAV